MTSSTAANPVLEELEFLNTDLKTSILSATARAKSLLCFVGDDSETSKEWEQVISEERIRSTLISETVTLRILPDTQEAQYLSGVAPIRSIPAVFIIKQGSVLANLQSAEQTSHDLKATLEELFGPLDGQDFSLYEDQFQSQDLFSWFPWIRRLPHFAWIMQYTDHLISHSPDNGEQTRSDSLVSDPAINPYVYIILPPSAGRMRLPNNAYDALGVQTQKWLDAGIRGDNVLRLQLRLLNNVEFMKDAVKTIETRPTGAVPAISSDLQNRLLNTPANALSTASSPSASASASGRASARASSPQSQTTTTPSNSRATAPSPAGATISGRRSPAQSSTPPPAQPMGTTASDSGSAQQGQRDDYIRQERERKAVSRAERDRIKEQIAADRAERRRQDDLRQSERKTELDRLRQANSTTRDPQSSDIRVQVRTFDGSTIRTTFANSASISKDVRPWIDEKASQSIPYNLKIIRTPEPNRNVEASEEEQSFSDLDIVASATLVMVPVRGFVDSYTGGGGLVSTVTGAVGSVVGGVLGGFGTLLGWGPAPLSDSSRASTQPQTTQTTQTTVTSGSKESNVRVRTLADQRAEEAQKQGNELYNGNQLNFQGRKDEDDDDKKHD